MSIFRGILSITPDINTAMSASISGWKVLYLGDPIEEKNIIDQYGFIIAMPLVPDYKILEKFIDGYQDEFDLEYSDQLGNPDTMSFFASILAALHQGINIVMYFPRSVIDLRYPAVLVQYIQQQFGIIGATTENQYMYNDSYDSANILLLYINNLVTHIDFLLNYNREMNADLIDRLCMQIGLRIMNYNDYDEKMRAIMEYKNTLIGIASTGREPVDVIRHDYSSILLNGGGM